MAELEVKLYQLGDLGTNCYIVSNKETKEAIVVDPADNANFIYRSLTDAGLACVGIFLTHGHYDHIGALDDLRKLTGVKAYASEDEKQVLESRTGNLSAVFGHPLETSAGKDYDAPEEMSFSYDDLLNLKFKLILPSDIYQKNADGTWADKSSDEDYMADVISKGLDIQVCGIIRQSESSYAASIDAGMIGYTAELAEYVVSENEKSEIVKRQLDNPDTDVFTGLPFSNGEDIDMSQVDMQQIVASMNLSEEQQAYISQMSDEQLFEMLKEQGYFAQSTATYDDNIEKLGFADLAKPSVISLYCSEFADKDKLTDLIDKYNDSHSDSEITYTDYIGLMLSSVTKIIDAITYVLIAFVAISLIVSSIMIGIITYISVLERTKEIGILRSIGASKKDISRVFNAETFIIGLVSGAIGILVTVLLNIPISKVIEKFVNVPNVSSLPVKGAVILVIISVVLTLIGGLIPSKMAAKKDPVIALRSE